MENKLGAFNNSEMKSAADGRPNLPIDLPSDRQQLHLQDALNPTTMHGGIHDNDFSHSGLNDTLQTSGSPFRKELLSVHRKHLSVQFGRPEVQQDVEI